MKKLILFTSIIMVMLIIILGWCVWQNNRDIAPLTQIEINQHFDQSVNWVASNYSTIKENNNPFLWWMLQQVSVNSNNETLKDIFLKYQKDFLDKAPTNLLTPLFDTSYQPNVPTIESLSNLQDYQKFFAYALSCDSKLEAAPVIKRQIEPEFCTSHFLQPRCITRQLMGLRFMQRYRCGYDAKISTTIDELQKVVVTELIWDFRVGDAYIQRVLMLVESGAYEQVKPIWVSNILKAQNDDGSWDDLHPILYLGNG